MWKWNASKFEFYLAVASSLLMLSLVYSFPLKAEWALYFLHDMGIASGCYP